MTAGQATDLKKTLESMFDQIEKKGNFVDQLTRISQIQLEIADTAPPQLTHFLEQRSYIKALEYLVQQ